MKILTTYSTDRSDLELAKTVILAQGETVDDLIPALSDEIVTELANAQAIGKKVTVKDTEANELDPTVFGVVEAIANGATCIIVNHVLPDGETYDNVYSINDLGE
jgi:hypothetical protein